MSKRPNVLYLHAHDTGRCIEPYGYPVRTPNLMALAEGGVLMRQCFCANPTCSPSRAALLTGQYPHTNGMTGLMHRGFQLNEPRRHLAATLRDRAQYRTVLVGVQHVTRSTEIHTTGYERKLELDHDPDRPDDHYAPIARAAARWLRDRPRGPFFLDVGLPKPHGYSGPPKDSRWVVPPPGLPDTAPTREHAARTHAGIEAMDRAMGLVLDALADAGLAANTLVVCTTDHGLAFPERKCNLTDGGLGVLSIWRGPGGCEGGRVIDGLVSHVDFLQTICEIVGIDPPDGCQGVSLTPLIRGEKDTVRDAIFGQINYHAAYQPERCVRTERYKYIRRFDHRTRRVMANCDDSPSKTLWVEHGWGDLPMAEECLFDVVLDPIEHRNLVDDERYAQPLQQMREALDTWMRDHADPLLEGFVEPPVDARINDFHTASPSSWVWHRRTTDLNQY